MKIIFSRIYILFVKFVCLIFLALQNFIVHSMSLPEKSLNVKPNINVQSKYVNSHDAVYRNVAMGRLVAGGGIIRTFNALPERFRKQLKIIWTSDGYTPHAIATHPRVTEDIRQKLLRGFLDINLLLGKN